MNSLSLDLKGGIMQQQITAKQLFKISMNDCFSVKQRHVLLVLVATFGTNFYPTISKLASCTGYTCKEVNKTLQELQDMGVIQCRGSVMYYSDLPRIPVFYFDNSF